ncbi:glycoside hydrolase family 13 protein [[Candida] arabinofermentans NRRL YB-2248]|uniref:Glycogen debranching enzyme n=1 Tax=[Candida] arabinofermentans NRRL YB-2248 TaxID=983967 RepID=A0A1E4SZG9_9ASCO|nr:glycoside hydrolase family 13 protein [[Candida] arabinofermentans NRRL YB-2248]
MPKVVLIRVSDTGEPITGGNSGVLTFPACPPDPDSKPGDPLFILRFYIVAGSKISNNGTIYTDAPPSHDKLYKRGKFYAHKAGTAFHKDTVIEVKIYNPGAYCYYWGYNSLDESHDEEQFKTTRKFYYIVPPSLYVNNNYLPLNAVSMQSMISKWMGEDVNKDWDPLFAEVARKGYNMIHFTPLQERGESNSPYSIYDQLTFDPVMFPAGKSDVKSMISNLETKHGILAMTDVVFNHTANNSQWLREHPDAGYNQETAPHLCAAIELDKSLLHFSKYMKWHGYPTVIDNVQSLLKVMDGIKIYVLGDLKLWQYYVVNVNQHLQDLENYWTIEKTKISCSIKVPKEVTGNLTHIAKFAMENCATQPFGLSTRFANSLQIDLFADILYCIYGDIDFTEIRSHAHKILDEMNLPLYKAFDEDNSEILEQLYNRINYQRIEEHGPKLGEVTEDSPLTEPYFTRFTGTDGKEWALANNGWIWGGNPLVDFASNESKCYLRREVIVWGDCVKLRYGSGPEDSPNLWNRMIEYAKLSASLFDGFRIDNCHSTPLHVGEALLDAARAVNPNLYIVAELFTGSEELDIIFVERLGISSLIREAMQAYSVGELSRLVHRHGGRPIGSFRWLPLDEISYPADPDTFKQNCSKNMLKKSEIPIPEILDTQAPHALFMDCTHDNETPAEKRTIEDTLPNAALVSFCSCATGTTFGYDECYPKLLNVVHDTKLYSYGNGIGEVKRKLNLIRTEIASQSIDEMECNEMHVHHEGQFITVHRTNARTGKGYFLIARTKFYQDGDQSLAPIVLNGTVAKHEFAYSLSRSSYSGNVEAKKEYIEPIPVELTSLSPLNVEFDASNNCSIIRMPDYFPQGSIAVLSTSVDGCDAELDEYVRTGAIEAASQLDLIDINAVLYKCESEERDASAGTDGVYNVPEYGHLVYAGIQGWISPLKDIIRKNDLAHPIAKHLRSGLWALDYISGRLTKYEASSPAITPFKNWLESRMDRIRKVPYFLVPRYFALIVGVAYEALRYKALTLMSPKIQQSTEYVQSLALVSIQMVSNMRSASINPFTTVPSMAAGLPHFSYDFMRCWGRDVFISVRGLLIATERYEEAKQHILNFAMTLKHGLIPNLLGSGKEPRYNARDAAWFFLECIQSYIKTAPNGSEILDCKVKRRFPLDDTYVRFDDERAFSYETSIRDIIYEILKRHAYGISYREANAGPQIDSQMKDEGFNVNIHVDWSTGLVHGGNQFNCGTWMDKMGESVRAGNKGFPGTPRDGAAIEINGLLKSALRFVIELNEQGLFPYTEVERDDAEPISFVDWNQLILDNFEKCYYIPEDPAEDSKFNLDPSIINRRGIYKDLYKSGKPYEDYQLRGNFPIAMCVAPELFTPSRALKCIQLADSVLRGPIGLATLDPSDFNYRPYYRNSEDNDDFATSKGRNYHQGPEWCWINGYFLRAFRKFHIAAHPDCTDENGTATDHLHQLLSTRMKGHKEWLANSVWSGLTELTNKNGELCDDSSPTQAWSASCLIDLYFDSWLDEGFADVKE